MCVRMRFQLLASVTSIGDANNQAAPGRAAFLKIRWRVAHLGHPARILHARQFHRAEYEVWVRPASRYFVAGDRGVQQLFPGPAKPFEDGIHDVAAEASRAASSTASIMLEGSARFRPAISNAVP